MIIEALKSKHFKGVLNATAPEPLTNVQTMRSLGRAMHRLSFIKTPHFILNFLLGERALLLSQGQRIIPKRSREFYFNFQYPVFEKALEDLLNND
jgi:NAD dependent epimerase/dehydratase family enzyme